MGKTLDGVRAHAQRCCAFLECGCLSMCDAWGDASSAAFTRPISPPASCPITPLAHTVCVHVCVLVGLVADLSHAGMYFAIVSLVHLLTLTQPGCSRPPVQAQCIESFNNAKAVGPLAGASSSTAPKSAADISPPIFSIKSYPSTVVSAFELRIPRAIEATRRPGTAPSTCSTRHPRAASVANPFVYNHVHVSLDELRRKRKPARMRCSTVAKCAVAGALGRVAPLQALPQAGAADDQGSAAGKPPPQINL